MVKKFGGSYPAYFIARMTGTAYKDMRVVLKIFESYVRENVEFMKEVARRVKGGSGGSYEYFRGFVGFHRVCLSCIASVIVTVLLGAAIHRALG